MNEIFKPELILLKQKLEQEFNGWDKNVFINILNISYLKILKRLKIKSKKMKLKNMKKLNQGKF